MTGPNIFYAGVPQECWRCHYLAIIVVGPLRELFKGPDDPA